MTTEAEARCIRSDGWPCSREHPFVSRYFSLRFLVSNRLNFHHLPFSFSKSIKNNTSSKSFLQNLSPSIALKRNKSRRRRERKGSNEKWMDRKILEWKIQRAMNTRFLTDRCINFLASSRYYRESWGSWFIYTIYLDTIRYSRIRDEERDELKRGARSFAWRTGKLPRTGNREELDC